jgi:hypothetical protein
LGGDGKGYIADLGLRKIRIFLQMGLDRILLICPSGKSADRSIRCRAITLLNLNFPKFNLGPADPPSRLARFLTIC